MQPPQSLKLLQHWVAYRAVPGKNGKIDKIPISPLTGANASSTDPASWGSYQAAVDRAECDNLAGVGFVFTGSGYTGIDLDHCVQPDGTIEDWARQIIERLDSYTEISPSGTGIHIIVKATLPPGRRRNDRIEMYDTGRFFTITGDQVDGMPDDVQDRQAEIKVLHAELFPPDTAPSGRPAAANTLTDDEVIMILAQSENAAAISALMAGDWTGYPSRSEADLALCSHLAFATGGNKDQMDRLFRASGLMRRKWNIGNPAYGERTIQQAINTVHNTYSSAPPGNGNQGAAVNPTSRRVTSASLLSFLHNAGYTFRINDCDDSLEINGQRITDVMRAEIRSRLRDNGLGRHLMAAEDAYLTEGGRHRYHPVREYLDSLNWDGQPHIETFCHYVVDRQGIFPLYFRKWMIGAVARAFTGVQNAVLVLDGAQGIGKSQLARWLCPLPGMFLDKFVNPDNKDDELKLITRWIWEISELGSTTRRADIEALKAFLSRETVVVRPPYGHYDVVKPSLSSFIGTANNSSGLFSDPTGNRRYWACTLESLDWEYSNQLDANQLWAEARAAYCAGESWTLTPNERKAQDAINAEFEVEDPIENLLRKHYTIDPNNPTLWTATVDILNTLQESGLQGNTRANQMALSATLRKLGLEKVKHSKINGYCGIR